MDIETTIQQLDQLKEKYRERSVSLLVGAGFSKNACTDFPSWSELLNDMADELYGGELGQAYDQFRLTHPSAKESLNSFKKRTIPSLIARKGYLTMVSEYVERKGFREAIEYYIEERIPYIDEIANTFRFTGKNAGVVIPVVKDNFSAHRKVFDGDWEQIYTTNYDHLLEYAFKLDGRDGYETLVIKNAPQLSMGRRLRTIIKLHGDLQRPGEDRVFEFDNNPHQQYIISKEDYLNYPKQHEAFTQLMRISLLQGVFCLVGFSGDDPNFQAWLTWVRDILARGTAEKTCKIFLVDKSASIASPAKSIFYENHNICYIPLEHPDIKKHIGSSSNDFREVLVDFFDYLYRGDKEDENKPEELPKPNPSPKYSSLWHKLDSDLSAEPVDKQQEEHEKTAADIIKEKPFNRIVRATYFQEEFLTKTINKESLSSTDALLSLIALQETGLPIACFDRLVDKLDVAVPESYRANFIARVERSSILCAKSLSSLTSLSSPYERLLKSVFSLEFGKARQILDTWEPEGTDILKKAYFASLFDVEASKQLFQRFIDESYDAKEQFYATRLLNVIENSLIPIHPTSFFASRGVPDYWQVGDILFRDLTQKKDEIHPHGEGKNVKIVYMDGGPRDVDYPKAMAILNYMMEAPHAISYRNFYTLRNAADWYKVHLEIFERHPFMALYYSLQCTDKKVKTRIGQDYAYSDSLAETSLPEILVNLFTAFISEDTPFFLKASMLRIAKEIIISVEPSMWEDLFMHIWKENVINDIQGLNDSRFPELKSLVFQALDCLHSTEYRKEIIRDVLTLETEHDSFAINCFYYLTKEDLTRDGVADAIDGFVAAISHPWQITVAGNLFSLLSQENKTEVKRKISNLLDTELFEDNDYRSASYFVSPEDAELKGKIARSICDSQLLWKTGVHPDGHYSSRDDSFLSITTYESLHLPDSAIEAIYNKLKTSLELISSSKVFKTPFYHIISIEEVLLEMLTFLNQNKEVLGKQADYQEVYSRVSEAYKKAVDNHSVEDGLLSIYDNELNLALDFIGKNRHEMSHDRLKKLMNLLLGRVLMMNSDGLDKSLRFIRFALTDGTIGPEDHEQLDSIVMILDRTDLNRLNACDMNLAHATNNLVAIAKEMSKRGYKSPGISEWISFADKHRFYTNFI